MSCLWRWFHGKKKEKAYEDKPSDVASVVREERDLIVPKQKSQSEAELSTDLRIPFMLKIRQQYQETKLTTTQSTSVKHLTVFGEETILVNYDSVKYKSKSILPTKGHIFEVFEEPEGDEEQDLHFGLAILVRKSIFDIAYIKSTQSYESVLKAVSEETFDKTPFILINECQFLEGNEVFRFCDYALFVDSSADEITVSVMNWNDIKMTKYTKTFRRVNGKFKHPAKDSTIPAITIGRSTGCVMCLKKNFISKVHISIESSNNLVVVRSLVNKQSALSNGLWRGCLDYRQIALGSIVLYRKKKYWVQNT